MLINVTPAAPRSPVAQARPCNGLEAGCRARRRFSFPMYRGVVPIRDHRHGKTLAGIFQAISIAREIWRGHGSFLMEDRGFSRLLSRYDAQIHRTRGVMQELRLFEICAHCARHTPGGSCCGKGIEEWYEVPVLLFNLMMGREILTAPPGPGDCLFLGPHGCRLWARHHFCVNYLCHRIHHQVSPEGVERLQAQAGRELYACWELEQLLCRLLGKSRGQGPRWWLDVAGGA